MMHRSSSTSRISDDFFINTEPPPPSSSSPPPCHTSKLQSSCTNAEHHQQLPTYNPLCHVAKKEKSRIKSAENAVHVIPLVLLFCAIILWFFSSPEAKM